MNQFGLAVSLAISATALAAFFLMRPARRRGDKRASADSGSGSADSGSSLWPGSSDCSASDAGGSCDGGGDGGGD